MKILIVCGHVNDQVQFLAQELEKMSLHIEITEGIHPLRLVMNKYDLIHFIHNDTSIDIKTVLSAWSAKALGAATILTTYSRLAPGFLQEFEFNFFDSITLPYISELKKMRFYRRPKIILPAFPATELVKHADISTEQKQFIFPVVKNFDELLKVNLKALPVLNDQSALYVDAHMMRAQKEHKLSSDLRKSWNSFIKKHSQFKNFKLFTQLSTLNEVLVENSSYTFLHHLDLTSEQVAFWMKTALTSNNFLILHEDQGTGFSNFWKTEKNCFIYSPRISAAEQLDSINTFLENRQSPDQLHFDFRTALDTKLNELARLYTKVVSQRASLMQPDSAKL